MRVVHLFLLLLLLTALLSPAFAKKPPLADAVKALSSALLDGLDASLCPGGAALLHKGGDPLSQAHAIHRLVAVRWQQLPHIPSEPAAHASALSTLQTCASLALRHTAALKASSSSGNSKAASLAHAASWSFLGFALSSTGRGSDASVAYAESKRLGGAITPFVAAWDMLGPFSHGKTELDGDPLEGLYPAVRGEELTSAGSTGVVPRSGIELAELDRGNRSISYPSELVDGGSIRWRELLTPLSAQGQAGAVAIQFPGVRWNDIAQSISMAALETQAWLVGVVHVSKAGRFAAQCKGVTSFSIDNHPLVGDIYNSDKVISGIDLARGPHIVRIRARSKVQGQFACSFSSSAEKQPLRLYNPAFVPDLVDFTLFSSLVPVPVLNLSPLFLGRLSWSLTGSTVFEVAPEEMQPTAWLGGLEALAPSVLTYVPLRIRMKEEGKKVTRCPGAFKLSLTASSGSGGAASDASKQQQLTSNTISIQFRCRRSFGESFLISFLDADGSVSHAGVIPPSSSGPCPAPGGGTLRDSCPTVVANHGMGVTASGMADSFKYMRKGEKEYTFGVENAWVLSPARFGAHNHQGLGARTIDRALDALASLSAGEEGSSLYLDRIADPERVVSTGHSMGGHGSWLWSVSNPDRLLCAAPAAGWISKELYGESNVPFEEDQGSSFSDPSLRGILMASVAGDNVDLFAAHLAGIPTMVRVGGDDRTTHPFYSRKMVRLLREWNARSFPSSSAANITYRDSLVSLSEVAGKEHWWWDTSVSNDGGVIHDGAMRAFWRRCLVGENGGAKPPPSPPVFTALALHVGSHGSKGGIFISQLKNSFQLASITVRKDSPAAGTWQLTTRNVARFHLREIAHVLTEDILPARGFVIDGQSEGVSREELLRVLHKRDKAPGAELCRDRQGVWIVCASPATAAVEASISPVPRRAEHTSGSMRSIYDRPFLFVVGTTGGAPLAAEHSRLGSFIAGLHSMASETHVRAVRDVDLLGALSLPSAEVGSAAAALVAANPNLILIGGPATNAYTRLLFDRVAAGAWASPVQFDPSASGGGVRVSGSTCAYGNESLALLALVPLPSMSSLASSGACGGDANAEAAGGQCDASSAASASSSSPALGLLLSASDSSALRTLARLAEPAIPPMVRAPFTNLAPDYLLMSSADTRWQGWGGVRAAGFVDAQWRHQQSRAYDTC